MKKYLLMLTLFAALCVSPLAAFAGTGIHLNSPEFGYATNGPEFNQVVGIDGYDYEAHVTYNGNQGEGFQVFILSENTYYKINDADHNVWVDGVARTMNANGSAAWLCWWHNNADDWNPQGDFWFYWNNTTKSVLVTTQRRASVSAMEMLGIFDNNPTDWRDDDSALRAFGPNANYEWISENQPDDVTMYTATVDFYSPKNNFRFRYNGDQYGPSSTNGEGSGELTISTDVVNDVQQYQIGNSYMIGSGRYAVNVYVKNEKIIHFQMVKLGATRYFDEEFGVNLYVRGNGNFAGNNGATWAIGNAMTRLTDSANDAFAGKYVWYAEYDRILDADQFKIGTGEAKNWMWGFTTFNPNANMGSYDNLAYDRYLSSPQVVGVDTNMSMAADSKEGATVYVVLIYDPVEPANTQVLVTYTNPAEEEVVDIFGKGLYLHYNTTDDELGIQTGNKVVEMERDPELPHIFRCTVYIPTGDTHFSFATAADDINNADRFGPANNPDAADDSEMPLFQSGDMISSELNDYEDYLNDDGETPDPENAGAWVLTDDENKSMMPYEFIFDTANNTVKVQRAIVTGIETIENVADAPAVYYNLQGVKVANPQAGHIYIVKRGSSVSKQMMR